MAPQATSKALGIHGVVLSISRADGASSAGRAHVTIGYAGFDDAYGGDYGSRLELVQLPACALTTPAKAACQSETPVGSANDARGTSVGADVTVPAAGTAATALAVVAGPSGSGGDFAAEPISDADNDWVTGDNSGAYTYSYSVGVPPVPGGLEPPVSLDYDSLTTAGLTSSTNNEASWAGDGWTLTPGFIETDFSLCTSDSNEPHISDMCADHAETTLSLDGVTTPLVDGTNGWRAEADGGARIQQIGNGWEVTETDGYQYYFGLSKLPGYATGDPTTNSQFTAPVWQACGQASFCTVPWRDMLDYVVDPRGNAMAYTYSTQTNAYAEQDGTTANGTYTAAGVLTGIYYGFRAGQFYTSTPAAKVTFTAAATRQDAPTDLACTSGSPCAQNTPTFWSTDQLTGISTQTLVNGAYQNVDSWSLAGSYPQPPDDPTTSPSLWLDSITHTGEDGSTPVTLPPVTFAGTAMPNRVMTPTDVAAGYSPITRFYLNSLTNEIGGVTAVAYASPYSTSGALPSPSSNTTTVYPDYWIPSGGTTPVLDWFNTLAVTSTTQEDTTGGSPPVVTSYTYSGAAWHFDTDTVSRSATVTWDQFRGFQTVTTETGTEPDPVTERVDSYLQGLSQDGPPSDIGPVVTFTTSRGQQLTDSNQFAGTLAESIAYNGAGPGLEVTDTVTAPWTSPATAVNTLLDQSAYLTGVGSTETYTALAGGGVRESVDSYTYTADGLVASESDVPDTTASSESTCVITAYASDTATGLLDLPSNVQTFSGACNSTGNPTGSLTSETESYYDGGALGSPPTAGDLTKSESAVTGGLTPTFATSSATYDEYGRVLTSTDADTRTTTTAYTPATGAEPTSIKVVDPMGLVTATSYDPARDLPLTVTDPTGGQSVTSYDALGRETAEWDPGNAASGPADETYSYDVSNTAPPVTTEQTEEPDGDYLTTDTIDDSLGDVREVQTETASGDSDVTDTDYDSDGWKALVSDPYYVAAAPSGTLVAAADTAVPSQTGYVYDDYGRVTRQISYTYGKDTWETDNTYGGDYTTVVPPPGGTATTTFTDGRGLTTAIYQYHAGVAASPSDPSSDYDQTTYTYTSAQKLSTTTDADNNIWSYTYDLLGDQLTASDPDAGDTSYTYDPAGLPTSATDARAKTTSYAYDLDGRETAEYDTTGGAAESSADEIASWSYDGLAKGKPTSSTSYQGGAAYTEAYTGYNAEEQPTGEQLTIPSAQGALAGTYTQSYTYAQTGQETSYTDSAAGNLSSETVDTGYDSAGEPDSLTGADTYVSNLAYTDLGDPLQYQEGTGSNPVYVTDSYDPKTDRLIEQNTQTGTADTSIDDLKYAYDDSGDVTSEADTPSGDTAATDVECFEYDYLGRLVEAWAQGSNGCVSNPSASTEGGAAPYLESYAYNTVGDLTGETSTSPTGATTTTAYTYPAAGTAQPHAVTGTSVTTSSGTTDSTYGYDTSGRLTSVSGAQQSDTLTWNDQDQLTEDAITPAGGSAQDTTYTYDADGKLLIRADPGTVTLLLGDEELVLNTATGSVAGTRFYSIGGEQVASSDGATVSYLIGDQQGTSSVAVDAATLDVTRRYFDPYGNPVGAAPTAWPGGQKGFVGGTTDTGTSLTDLGAREYQPGTESFISPDPLLDPYDPQDLNAYAYASDNPTTLEDPTGQAPSPATCRKLPPNEAKEIGCNGTPSKPAQHTDSPAPSTETCRHLDSVDAEGSGCNGAPRGPEAGNKPAPAGLGISPIAKNNGSHAKPSGTGNGKHSGPRTKGVNPVARNTGSHTKPSLKKRATSRVYSVCASEVVTRISCLNSQTVAVCTEGAARLDPGMLVQCAVEYATDWITEKVAARSKDDSGEDGKHGGDGGDDGGDDEGGAGADGGAAPQSGATGGAAGLMGDGGGRDLTD